MYLLSYGFPNSSEGAKLHEDSAEDLQDNDDALACSWVLAGPRLTALSMCRVSLSCVEELVFGGGRFLAWGEHLIMRTLPRCNEFS